MIDLSQHDSIRNIHGECICTPCLNALSEQLQARTRAWVGVNKRKGAKTIHAGTDCPWAKGAELAPVVVEELPNYRRCQYCFG